MIHRLTLEEIKKRLFLINPNFKITSTSYVNAKTKLSVECCKCNSSFNATWDVLSRGRGCNKCSKRKLRSIDEFKEDLKNINPNIEVLSEVYVSATSKLKCRCSIDNHEWEATPNNLLRGYGCKKCYLNNKGLGVAIFMERINENNERYIPISDFKNLKTNMEFYCKKHKLTFIAKARSITEGHNGCPKCYSEAISGENSGKYKGVIRELSDYLRDSVAHWRSLSFEDCEYKCVVTNEKKDLVIHHLYSYGAILDEAIENLKMPLYKTIDGYSSEELTSLRLEMKSLHKKYGLGVCLTQEEHKKFHKKYGYGDNTPEQFKEFYNLRKSENSSTTIESVA